MAVASLDCQHTKRLGLPARSEGQISVEGIMAGPPGPFKKKNGNTITFVRA